MRYHAIMEELDHQIQLCNHHIISPSNILNFESYKYYVGVIYGLNLAKEAINNHLKEKVNDTKL